jgi:hypothetical protein
MRLLTRGSFITLVWVMFACAPSATPAVVPTPPEPTALPPVVQPSGPVGPLPLALDPIPVSQGGQVTVSARGFAAGETVSFSTTDGVALGLGQATASSVGTVDALTLAVPEVLESGPHAIQALGSVSGRESSGTLWIRARERWVVLSSQDVQPYASDWGLIAGGFEPQEQVQVSIEPRAQQRGDATPSSAAVPLLALPTDQAGNTEWAPLKLPITRAGAYSLVLQGTSGGPGLRHDLTVKPLTPTADLSPWAGPPGIPVQFNAQGFAPNERVHATWGAASTAVGADANVLQADADGNLWGAGPIRVPGDAAAGSLLLVLVGEDSGAQARPEFKVQEPKPWLELTSWSGAPGAPVSFGGGGWIGGEHVSFHIDTAAAPPAAVGQADDYGWLRSAGTIYVPLDAEQDVIFVAVGEQSHRTVAATFTVVLPFGLRPHASAPTPPTQKPDP